MNFKVSEEEVGMLSKLANLPLDKQRYKEILPPLNEWIEAANQLNLKMSNSQYSSIMPITIFTHPESNPNQNNES
jgi:hypothetical protein